MTANLLSASVYTGTQLQTTKRTHAHALHRHTLVAQQSDEPASRFVHRSIHQTGQARNARARQIDIEQADLQQTARVNKAFARRPLICCVNLLAACDQRVCQMHRKRRLAYDNDQNTL